MGNYGMKVSKVGFSITETGANNLAFSSSFNQLKISVEGTTTISWNASETTTKQVAVNHSLGYSPAFIAFIKRPDDGYWYPFDDLSVPNSGGPVYRVRSWASTTQLVFEVKKEGSPLNANSNTIKYYILVEDG